MALEGLKAGHPRPKVLMMRKAVSLVRAGAAETIEQSEVGAVRAGVPFKHISCFHIVFGASFIRDPIRKPSIFIGPQKATKWNYIY